MKYNKLSYIVPTYNAKKFLEETIESIYKQKLKISFEIIISDDNSSDNTQEKIIELAKKYSEIKYYFNQKNLGAPANRNYAISKSRGDLIYMLDHDNILDENSIQKLIDTINKRGTGAASFEELYFFKGDINDHRGSWIYKYPNDLFTIKEYLTSPNSPANSNNYMFTRVAFNKTGGYPNRGARENLGFALRLVATGTHIAIVPNTKYYHRIISNGMWHEETKNFPERGHSNMALIFREFLDLFDKKSQKLLLNKNAEKKADNYIKKKIIKLSDKGWELAGRKEKYRPLIIKKYYQYQNTLKFYLRNLVYKLKILITKIIGVNNRNKLKKLLKL